MAPRRDDQFEDQDPLSREERWSFVYFSGRQDGAREATINHRLAANEEEIKGVKSDIHESKKFLMGLVLTGVGNLFLMIFSILGQYFHLGGH